MPPVSDPAVPPSPEPQITGILQRLARRPYMFLALACLLLWLPGVISLPPLDRDESRFAQSSRQMLQSGDVVDIRFGDVPRYKKPVGIYWAQAAATAIAQPFAGDHHIWSYRLPSLAGGIIAVWLTFWCGALWGGEVGFVAALLMGFSLLLAAEASIATTDALLLACVMGVQGVLLRLYRAGQGDGVATRTVMFGWAALGIGILVKGPLILGVAAATIAALLLWDRIAKTDDWRWLKNTRPLSGLLLAAVIVLPWVIAIAVQSRGAFFAQSLGNDFAAKLAGGQESHGAPPGYYLVSAALAFWPAILFILPGIGLGVARRADAGMRFLLAWAASWWLVVEVVPTKLPHYVLPAYPALAILAALFLLAPRDGARRYLTWIAGLQFLIGLAVLVAAPVLLPRLYGGGDAPMWLLSVAAAGGVIGLVGLLLALLNRRGWALTTGLLAFTILAPTLTVGVAPRLTQLWVSERLALLAAAQTRPGDPAPALAGYTEPSLVFALGKDVTLTDGRGAAQRGADAGGLALVEDTEKPAYLARLAELQTDAQVVAAMDGFNYSRGRKVHITLYRATRLDARP